MTRDPNIPNVYITWDMLQALLQVASTSETTCSGSVLIAHTDDSVARVPFRNLHHHDLGTLIANQQKSPDDIWEVTVTRVG